MRTSNVCLERPNFSNHLANLQTSSKICPRAILIIELYNALQHINLESVLYKCSIYYYYQKWGNCASLGLNELVIALSRNEHRYIYLTLCHDVIITHQN